MAIPVLTLLALLARAATYIIIHPTLWLALLAWFAVSGFDFSVAVNQLEQSIAKLWWLVALILLTAICNTAIKAYFRARRYRDQ